MSLVSPSFFKDKPKERDWGPEGLGKYKDLSELQNSVGAEPPKIDDRYKALQTKQIGQAKDFRTSIPKRASSLMTSKLDAAKDELAQRISGIREGYNSRGLLYSGMRAGEEAGARGDYAANVAQQRAELNQGLLDTANQMEDRAIDTGFGMAGMGSDLGAQNTLTNARLQAEKEAANTRRGTEIAKGFGGGIGQLAGAIAAGGGLSYTPYYIGKPG